MPQWGKQLGVRRDSRLVGRAQRAVGITILVLISTSCGSGGTEAASESVDSTVVEPTSTSAANGKATTKPEVSTTVEETTTKARASTTTEKVSATAAPTTTAAPATQSQLMRVLDSRS